MSAISWAILTACIWGVVPVLEKTGLKNVDSITGLFYRCIGVVMGLIFLSLFMIKPQQLKAVDAKSIGLLILSGILASLVAQLTFYKCLKMGEISRVVPISASYPLIAFLLGIFIFREKLTFVKGMGMFLIISGIWALRAG